MNSSKRTGVNSGTTTNLEFDLDFGPSSCPSFDTESIFNSSIDSSIASHTSASYVSSVNSGKGFRMAPSIDLETNLFPDTTFNNSSSIGFDMYSIPNSDITSNIDATGFGMVGLDSLMDFRMNPMLNFDISSNLDFPVHSNTDLSIFPDQDFGVNSKLDLSMNLGMEFDVNTNLDFGTNVDENFHNISNVESSSGRKRSRAQPFNQTQPQMPSVTHEKASASCRVMQSNNTVVDAGDISGRMRDFGQKVGQNSMPSMTPQQVATRHPVFQQKPAKSAMITSIGRKRSVEQMLLGAARRAQGNNDLFQSNASFYASNKMPASTFLNPDLGLPVVQGPSSAMNFTSLNKRARPIHGPMGGNSGAMQFKAQTSVLMQGQSTRYALSGSAVSATPIVAPTQSMNNVAPRPVMSPSPTNRTQSIKNVASRPVMNAAPKARASPMNSIGSRPVITRSPLTSRAVSRPLMAQTSNAQRPMCITRPNPYTKKTRATWNWLHHEYEDLHKPEESQLHRETGFDFTCPVAEGLLITKEQFKQLKQNITINQIGGISKPGQKLRLVQTGENSATLIPMDMPVKEALFQMSTQHPLPANVCTAKAHTVNVPSAPAPSAAKEQKPAPSDEEFLRSQGFTGAELAETLKGMQWVSEMTALAASQLAPSASAPTSVSVSVSASASASAITSTEADSAKNPVVVQAQSAKETSDQGKETRDIGQVGDFGEPGGIGDLIDLAGLAEIEKWLACDSELQPASG